MIPFNQLDFDFEPTRLKRQISNINAWIDNNRCGSVIGATGYGKTTVGVFAIRNIIKFFGENEHIIVVVPTNYLKDQWESILSSHEILNVDVIVVNTLVKHKYNATLLVLDEIHRYTAEEFGKVYDCVSYEYILGLSATIDTSNPKFQVIENRCPIVDSVPIEECLENNWVSMYTTYTLGLDLDSETKKAYDKQTKTFNSCFSTFDFNFQTMQKCLDKRNAEIYAKGKNWDTNTVHYNAMNGFKSMNKRKDIIAEAKIKIETTKKLLNEFTDRKIITFSKQTETADELAKDYPDGVAYHSNLPTLVVDKVTGEVVGQKIDGMKGTYYFKGVPKKWKEIPNNYKRVSKNKQLPVVIKQFINDEKRILFTAKAIDEGADIPSADMGITISGDSSFLRGTQRRGRIIRYQPDKKAIEVHLYIRNTKDEDWVRKRLKGVPNVIDVNSIDEIR